MPLPGACIEPIYETRGPGAIPKEHICWVPYLTRKRVGGPLKRKTTKSILSYIIK